jgi:Trypsin-like peptidase domain
VPHIPKQWLDAVVYLYPAEDDARRGARTGATGFIVSVPLEDSRLPRGHSHHYVVTNAHAVEGQDSIAVRINMRAGGFDVMTIPGADWITHPDRDDVAAAALPMNPAHQYAAVDRSMILTQELLDHWGFGPGDEVFFVGRYRDREGKDHNVRTVRSGILSAFPAEPINQPDRDHGQETVLVEARSLSGYSGSPVFITPAPYIDKSQEPGGPPVVRAITGGPCFLLGIDWGHQSWTEPVLDPVYGRPVSERTYVRVNSGMMMVIRATKLLSLLDVERFADGRRETECQLLELLANLGNQTLGLPGSGVRGTVTTCPVWMRPRTIFCPATMITPVLLARRTVTGFLEASAAGPGSAPGPPTAAAGAAPAQPWPGNGRPWRELQQERTQLGRRVRRSRGDVAGAECQAEC